MRTFLPKFLLFVSLVALGFALLLWRYPTVARNRYSQAIIDKDARLRAIPAPRLILVGGSNIAFGLDSVALEQSLRRPVVNLGVVIDLGHAFQLNQAAAHVRSGDLVILSLEYAIFDLEVPSAEALLAILQAERETWRYFDARHWKSFIDGGLANLGAQARASFTLAQEENSPSPGLYRRSGFNAHGDFIAHHGQPSATPSPRPVIVSERALRLTLEDIATFVARCHTQGATVCFELHPWPETWVRANPALVERIYAGLRRVPGLVLLNTPAEASFPPGLFYDTEYHLTQEGGARRTRELIRSLSTAGLP